MEATMHGHPEVVKHLTQRTGADVKAVDSVSENLTMSD